MRRGLWSALLAPKPWHAKGISGFYSASAAVFMVLMGTWSAIDGNWGIAVLLISIAPIAGFMAVVRYRAGNWWYAGSRLR